MTINRDFAENLRAGGDLSGTFDITGDLGTFNNLTVNTGATVPYDNSISGLTATNIQSAITELNTLLGGGNIGSQATWNVYEFTTVGNDTSFDISTQGSPAPSYVPGYVKVYLNGLLLSESDYTAVDGSTVNFSPAIVDSGQIVSIVVLDSFNTAELLRVTSIDASASTNTLVIDSNSNVGIGINNPAYKLDISGGGIRLDGQSILTSNAYFVGSPVWGFRWNNSTDTLNNVIMYDNGDVWVREKLGIGIDPPGVKLDIKDTSATGYSIRVGTDGGSAKTIVYADTLETPTKYNWIAGSQYNINNGFEITPSTAVGGYTFSTPALTILQDGKVGIGTTAPDLTLHIDGVNGYLPNTGTTPAGMLHLRAKTEGGTHGLYVGVADAIPFGSWIQSADANNLATQYPLLLNPNGGNVGIGTTSPNGKLEIQYDMDVDTGGITALTASKTQYGSINFTGAVSQGSGATGTTMQGLTWQIQDYVGTTDYGVQAQLVVGNNGSAGTFMGFFTSDNYSNAPVERIRIDSSGNVGIGTGEPKARLVVQDNITHTSNPPTYRGSLIIASDGSQTSAGGLEFHSSIGGGAGYGGRIVTDSSANMLFFARSNATGWTKTFSLDPTGSAALPGTLTLNNNTEKFVAPVYRGTATGVSNAGYTTLFTATGGGYGSTVKFTLVGTASNVVVNLTTDLIVGHFEDILISTQSGFYTTVTLKVTSDNNAGFAVEATTNHASAVNLDIEVFPFSNEQVTFTNSHGYTGSSLTHTAYYGHSISGTGGDFGNIRTAGNITVERNIVAERAMIKQAATSADVSALASGSVSFSLGSLVNSNRGVYEFTLFGFSDGGAQQNGGVAHLYLMANPDDVSFTVISQKTTTIDSVTFSGGTLTVNFTNTSSGFSMQGIKASIRKMVDG